MADIVGVWKAAYREAPLMAKVQILYMVIVIPALLVGGGIHLARFV